GRAATALVLAQEDRVALHPATGLAWTHGANIGREPRDAAEPGAPAALGTLPNAFGPEAALHGLALLRACQIAGALEAVLDMTVTYATTRKQFGRPIGGFQAVQQLLARCAAEVAATGVAVAHACRAADRRGLGGAAFEIGCAKVVAGEAAGSAAAIAHQVHAAIGITDEHALHLLTRRLWSWRDEGGAERFWAARIGAAAIARGGAALWPDLTAREEENPA
ncbi:MAG TPA: acyl-CoA dehydrogenase family protein, partial [Crenalkalicoccus sp.]|nr:acyl-CoA dehydrogenase family protein [Crenalkalicoccus sp.]